MMLDGPTKNRLEQALAGNTLKALAMQMKWEGMSQVAIYCIYNAFSEFLSEQSREPEEEVLHGCLECISGFCSAKNYWFECGLDNEEIYAHLSGLTVDDIQQIATLIRHRAPTALFYGVQIELPGQWMAKAMRLRQGTVKSRIKFKIERQNTGWVIIGESEEAAID